MCLEFQPVYVSTLAYVCVCVWRAYIYDMWYMHMIDMGCM